MLVHTETEALLHSQCVYTRVENRVKSCLCETHSRTEEVIVHGERRTVKMTSSRPRAAQTTTVTMAMRTVCFVCHLSHNNLNVCKTAVQLLFISLQTVCHCLHTLLTDLQSTSHNIKPGKVNVGQKRNYTFNYTGFHQKRRNELNGRVCN